MDAPREGVNKALENPEVQRQLSVADIPGRPMSLSELAALMKADYEKLTTVVKASGMTPPRFNFPSWPGFVPAIHVFLSG
jgi:tripartite-type tricarboxylate transporter receptor subunit TctC